MEQITITTERLILRPVSTADTSAIHEYASDKSITMMMYLPKRNNILLIFHVPTTSFVVPSIVKVFKLPKTGKLNLKNIFTL